MNDNHKCDMLWPKPATYEHHVREQFSSSMDSFINKLTAQSLEIVSSFLLREKLSVAWGAALALDTCTGESSCRAALSRKALQCLNVNLYSELLV